MSFPRYPAYKDSGVEWLGSVPSSWRRARFKEVFREREERSIAGEETLLSVSAYTGVTPRSEILDDGDHLSRAESLEGYKVCYPNDLVMNIMLAWNRGLGISPLHGICSPAYSVFQVVDGSSPRYLHYLLRSDEYIRYFKAFSAGVIDSRLRLYPDAFGALSTYLPSSEEQEQIGGFLDRETAKIDALVAEQEQLITLLKEKRQAVISHAVTKGLDPSFPMKDSGVEWLGEVPAHWETRTIAKASTKITNGFVGPTRDILFDEGIPYIQATHIKNGKINFGHDYFVREEWSLAHKKSVLSAGDVLIVQTGAGTGDVGLVSEAEAGCNCHALIIIASDPMVLRGGYLAAVLTSTYGRSKLTSIQTGAMHPHLNCGEVKFVELPLPPLQEQAAIESYVGAATQRFDDLIDEAVLSIELLRERRSALISAAVTGQIDVRGLATAQAQAA